MKKILKKLNLTTQLSLINLALYCVFGVFVYPLIPYLLNYPPNSIDNDFQLKVAGMKYTEQFMLLLVLGIILNFIIFYIYFRKLNKWKEIVYSKDTEDINVKKEITKIRNLASNGIYKLIPIHIIINAVVIFVLLFLASTDFILIAKLSSILCIWCAISDLLLVILSNRLFNNILKETYNFEHNNNNDIKRIGIGTKMLMQYASCIMVILFILSLFGYSRVLYERGEFLKEKEYNNLQKIIEESEENILENIQNKYTEYFIMDVNGENIYNCENLSEFAKEYILTFNENNNRFYYQYGSDIEGVFEKVIVNDNVYFIGKTHKVMPLKYSLYFIMFPIILFGIYLLIIICYIKNLTNSLKVISTNLNEIGSDENGFGEELPITSNDEFSEFITAYNKIQKNSERYIKEIEEKQDIIVKQQQLVSIGELAGGVAHDINTPISAIKTGIVMLNTMSEERTDSEKEILERMDNCSTKIINIVNSMRNQIRNLGSTTKVKFKISSVLNDIKIITYHEMNKNHCEINMNIEDDVEIMGDPTKLGQVFTNLVVNAAQAYDEKGGKIDIMVSKTNSNSVLINIIDYAGGIDETIAPFVFKNILTTKGTSGTGLGLYLAYSIIKGEFNGEIYFNTEKGEGTTFSIRLPIAE